MAEKALVIVESPTKARTIRRFLPNTFTVESSVGHIRDLPQSPADVPARIKTEPWARLGIDVEHDFTPVYVTPRGKGKLIRELKAKLKEADVLYLATDEDREGESISWHLMEVLKPKVPVRRMVFHEITRGAIQHALENYRSVDLSVVRAQETRRILDRLYGYSLSPLVWKKIAYGLSAGRVQSPGLRLIVDRERERIRFRSAEYWDLKAQLSGADESRTFEARLVQVGDRKLTSGKDFNPETGLVKSPSLLHLSEADAAALRSRLETGRWTVTDVTYKDVTNKPAPPFITSTLQQEANRKLGMGARDTMRTAQRLYEEGFITYMRTDSPALSTEAITGARNAVAKLFGADYLPDAPRLYTSRSKDAQEAHEAIRPAGEEFRHPDETGLTDRERALYELIWKRTLAGQMTDAKKRNLAVRISVEDAVFVANGTRIVFPGFLRVYVEGKDNPDAALDDREVILPPIEKGDTLNLSGLEALGHTTKPPARFTEASLVQNLESRGIGRPSTYAAIIGTLFERSYIRRAGGALAPTFTGMAVIQLLETHFHELIDYGFTSDMETALDEISRGEREFLEYLRQFYLGDAGLRARVDRRESEIQPEKSRTIAMPQLKEHQEVKVGRYGPYIIHYENGEEIHASIPEEYAPADLTELDITELIEIQKRGPEPIGIHPDSGEPIFCMSGRYGPYLQLGETDPERAEKPRRASLPKGMKPSDVTMEQAVHILSLPRVLGLHPEKGIAVSANVGRFGPFVVCDGEFRSLKKDDDVYTISLERAIELLATEKTGKRGSTLLKDFGSAEGKARKLAIYEGRYGPYIKAGTKNIGLPEQYRTSEAIEKLSKKDVEQIVKEGRK